MISVVKHLQIVSKLKEEISILKSSQIDQTKTIDVRNVDGFNQSVETVEYQLEQVNYFL